MASSAARVSVAHACVTRASRCVAGSPTGACSGRVEVAAEVYRVVRVGQRPPERALPQGVCPVGALTVGAVNALASASEGLSHRAWRHSVRVRERRNVFAGPKPGLRLRVVECGSVTPAGLLEHSPSHQGHISQVTSGRRSRSCSQAGWLCGERIMRHAAQSELAA